VNRVFFFCLELYMPALGTSVQSSGLHRSFSMPNLQRKSSDIAAQLRGVGSGPALATAQESEPPRLQTMTSSLASATRAYLLPTDFAKAQENSSLACLFACGDSAELTSIYDDSSNVFAQQEVMNFAKVYTQLSKTEGITNQQKEALDKLAKSFCKLIQKDGLKLEKSCFSAWYPQVNKTYVGRIGLEKQLSKLVAEVTNQQGGSAHQLGSNLMIHEAMPFICQYLEQQLNGELTDASRAAVSQVIDRSAMQAFEALRATRSELLAKAGSSNTIGQLGRDLDLIAVLPQLLRDILGAAKPAGRDPDVPSELPAAATPPTHYPERLEPDAVQAPVVGPDESVPAADTHGLQPSKQGDVRDSHDIYIINHNYSGTNEPQGTANSVPVNREINPAFNPTFNPTWDAQPRRGTDQTDSSPEVTTPFSEGQAAPKRFISSLDIQLEEPTKRGDAHMRATQSESSSIERQSGLGATHRVSSAEDNTPVFHSSLNMGTLKGVRNIRSDETLGRTAAQVLNNEQPSELLQSKLGLSAKPQPLVAEGNIPLEDRLIFAPLGKRVTESYLKSHFFQSKFNGENSKPTSASAAHVLVTDIRGVLQLTTGQEVGRKGESFLKVRNTFLPVNVRDTHEDYLAPMTDQQWGILLDGLNQHPQVADIKARVLTMARLTSIAAPLQWLKDSIVPRMLQWAGREVISLASVKGANDQSYAEGLAKSVGELSTEADKLGSDDLFATEAVEMVWDDYPTTEADEMVWDDYPTSKADELDLGELSSEGDELDSDDLFSEADELDLGELSEGGELDSDDLSASNQSRMTNLSYYHLTAVEGFDEVGLVQGKNDE
jgi:hypothetical protein